MATDSILGLFTDPYQYMQQQNQAQDAAAMKFAQLNPMERAQYGIYRGAGQLGGAAAGALGVQDPALQMQSTRTKLAQGKDFTTSEGWANYAKELQQAGDYQGAVAAAQKSTQLQSQIDEKQAAREQQLQIARERIQAQLDIAAQRGADAKELQQMRIEGQKELRQLAAGMGSGLTNIRQQILEQQLGDLKSKAAERESAAQSQSMGRVAAFDSALDTLDIIAKHPGKKDVVGALTGGVMSIVPGTNAAGFASQLETFKAQTFIPQVSALKGMGALSDAEGKKLTAAVGALDTKMKPAEFDASLNRIRSDLEAAKQRAAKMPGMPTNTSFNSVEEATKANLPKGTIITIGGRRAVVE